MSIAIVIDTDIVRAASNSSADHAKLCASILEAIRDNNELTLALSKELKTEWLKQRENGRPYISYFAYVWWADMQSQGRVEIYPIDYKKGEAILDSFSDDTIRKRVEKDLHIVLTALSANKRLISNNTQERKHFQSACPQVPCLADILWPDPVNEEVVDWLNRNAPRVPKYLVCN